MNLADVLTLRDKEQPPDLSGEDRLLARIAANRKRIDATRAIRPAATHEEDEVLEGMMRKMTEQFDRDRASLLVKYGHVPEEMTVSASAQDDPIMLASRTPKVSLDSVRTLADLLSFVVLPFRYLDERSYAGEPWEVRETITGFARQLDPWFDIHVLAPVPYYDVQKHVRDKDDMDLYPGRDMAQAFTAIALSIPMFRMLMGETGALRLDQALLARQLEETTKRMDAMQKQIDAIRVEQAIAAAKAEMRVRLEERRASRARFFDYEPMMLAVPKGVSIHGNGWAIVGPCWGPDFDDIVMASVGLAGIEGQRGMLTEHAARWLPSRSR